MSSRPGEPVYFVTCCEIIEVEATKESPAHPDVCGNIAEVFERYYLRSTEGKVYFHRTRCIKGHVLDVEQPPA